VSALDRMAGWLARVTGRHRFADEMREELEFHVDARTEDLERRGLPRAEALRRARVEFGARARYEQEGRDQTVHRFVDDLQADLRDAWRGLRRDRGFAALAVSIVAAMLTADMVLFAFLDAYFLRPLPIAGAERHVEVHVQAEAGRGGWRWPLADVERFLAAHADVLESGYAFAARRVVIDGREPRRVYVEVVSPSYFDLVAPALQAGRLPGAGQVDRREAAILMSAPGARRLVGDGVDPIGRTLLVDGVALTVVGVLRPGAGGLEPVTPDFWMLAGAADRVEDGRPQQYHVAGLLRAGLSLEQGQAALRPGARTLDAAASPDAPRRLLLEPRTTLMRESRELQPLALALLFLFGLVTLVAAANLTNLHLARATSRRRELAIRVALGASRARLVRQILTESLLVAGLAALLAWGVSAGSIALLQGHVFGIVSEAGMSMQAIHVDARIVAAVLVLAAAAGLVCGLAPALHATRRSLVGALQRDGLWLSGRLSAGRLRGALVALQVALSLPLLVGSGILVRASVKADATDAGYRLEGLVDLRADPATAALVARLRELPGVTAVSVASHTPLQGQAARRPARVAGSVHRLAVNEVDERFFGTVGFAVTRGRGFRAGEADVRAPIAVISEATARLLFPGAHPLGRNVELESPEREGEFRSHEVVGVAADVTSGWFFEGLDASAVYLPRSLEPGGRPEILMRLERDDAAALAALRAACADLGSFCDPHPLRRLLYMQRVPFMIASQVATALGVLALGLACLGLYGLVRYAVVQRTREFGVRLALGATRGRILRSVLGESTRRLAVGLALGLPICLAVSALLAARVPFLEPFDPLAYVVVPPALAGCALVASLAPARRAAAIDPIAVIREE